MRSLWSPLKGGFVTSTSNSGSESRLPELARSAQKSTFSWITLLKPRDRSRDTTAPSQ